jgi:hypothetical protein
MNSVHPCSCSSNCHLESAFVHGRCGVRNAEKRADSSPEFPVVVNTWAVADRDSRPVEKVDVKAPDSSVRSRDGNVPFLHVGRVIRPTRSHQIRSPFVKNTTTYWGQQNVNF